MITYKACFTHTDDTSIESTFKDPESAMFWLNVMFAACGCHEHDIMPLDREWNYKTFLCKTNNTYCVGQVWEVISI